MLEVLLNLDIRYILWSLATFTFTRKILFFGEKNLFLEKLNIFD